MYRVHCTFQIFIILTHTDNIIFDTVFVSVLVICACSFFVRKAWFADLALRSCARAENRKKRARTCAKEAAARNYPNEHSRLIRIVRKSVTRAQLCRRESTSGRGLISQKRLPRAAAQVSPMLIDREYAHTRIAGQKTDDRLMAISWTRQIARCTAPWCFHFAQKSAVMRQPRSWLYVCAIAQEIECVGLVFFTNARPACAFKRRHFLLVYM